MKSDDANAADDESCTTSSEDEEEDMVQYGLDIVNSELEQKFSNTAFMHGTQNTNTTRPSTDATDTNCTPLTATAGDDAVSFTVQDLPQRFEGVMIDTGANRSSTMSLSQYENYCREHMTPAALHNISIDTSRQKKIKGIGGTIKTIGQARVRIPISGLGIELIVVFNIVPHDSPTILCLQDMKRMGIDISIQEDSLTLGDKMHSLVLENNLLWLKWESTDYTFYTETELRKLHRSFGHPSAKALAELLKRARPTDPYVHDELDAIIRECAVCAKNASIPRRFKLTVGTEDVRFNHIVAVDIVTIEGKQVLHCVDESTHFQAAAFLTNMKSETVWKALVRCWSNVYIGPPDHLRVDQGSNLVS